MNLTPYLSHCLLPILSLLLLACGGSSESDGGGGGNRLSVSVTPSAGGSINSGSGQTLLEVPNNAVATQSTIEIEQFSAAGQPESERLKSRVYRLSGEHEPFLNLPSLYIPLEDHSIPENHSVHIAQLVNGHWFELPGTEFSDGVAKVRIHKMADYAVVTKPITKLEKQIGPECDTESTTQTISFVHLADLHSNYGIENIKMKNGYAKFRAFYEEVLAENPFTLFTNSADDFEKGSVAEALSQGEATVAVTKAMAFDIRTVGNHDFAWGAELFKAYVDDPQSIVLTSNTIYQAEDYESFAGVEYAEIEVGCVTLGFLGLVGYPWNEFDSEFAADYLDTVAVDLGVNSVAERIINEHRDDVDLIIILSHLGIGYDEAMATYVDGIDIILGGHSHQGVYYNDSINDTIILQPNFSAKGLTRLDVDIDLSTRAISRTEHRTYLTKDLSSKDSEIETLIDGLIEQYAPDAHTTLGQFSEDQTSIALTQLVTRSVLGQNTVSGVLLDPERVTSDDLPAGDVTQQQIYTVFEPERQRPNTPGFNALYRVTLTGADLSAILASQPNWVWGSSELGVGTVEEIGAIDNDFVSDQEYTLIVDKASALNSELLFGEGIQFTQSSLVYEIWESIDRYVRTRTGECLYIDVDAELEGCIL